MKVTINDFYQHSCLCRHLEVLLPLLDITGIHSGEEFLTKISTSFFVLFYFGCLLNTTLMHFLIIPPLGFWTGHGIFFFISSNIWNVLWCNSGRTHILKFKESGPFTLCHQFSCDSSYSTLWRSPLKKPPVSSLSPARPSVSSVTGSEILTTREIDFCH